MMNSHVTLLIVVACAVSQLKCTQTVDAGKAEEELFSDSVATGALQSHLEGELSRTVPERTSWNDMLQVSQLPFEGNERSSITSSVQLGDGTDVVAGVFSGTLDVHGQEFRSRGGNDVFVARRWRNGTVGWVRTVGSEQDEGNARVTFDRDRLFVMALTGGRPDCGENPLREWNSEAFLLCTFDVHGNPLVGGSFPTGRR
ncbi:MAG TPA: hypothetical protein VM580_12610 [Labilithrix sp.]|jgi:hypothetical protein|nr:hypothetical protein [Labilithrix sp.]